MLEEQIEFDERVDEVYPFGVPRVIQPFGRQNVLESLISSLPGSSEEEEVLREPSQLDPEASRLIQREIIATGRAIRRREPPSTVLHALIVQPEATLGQLAGIAHQDPRDLEIPLTYLVEIGWVRVSGPTQLPRYSLAGLDD